MSKLSDKIGGFVTVPNTVVKMIPQMGTKTFTLWCYLRFRTNGESEVAFPSYDTIQRDTGLHRRDIAAGIRKCEDLGLMERRKRFSASTEYTLVCPYPNTITSSNGGTSDDSASRSTIGTTVVPPLEPQSFHHWNTNKIESNKTDLNKNSVVPTGDAEWAALKSALGEEIMPGPSTAQTTEQIISEVHTVLGDPNIGKTPGISDPAIVAKLERATLSSSVAVACGMSITNKDTNTVAKKLTDEAKTIVWADGPQVSAQEISAYLLSVPGTIKNPHWVPTNVRTHFARMKREQSDGGYFTAVPAHTAQPATESKPLAWAPARKLSNG